MNGIPRWRIAAAVVVLAGLAFLGARLAPVYYRSFLLQRYVSRTTEAVENRTHSDDVLRTGVLEKAQSLDLPLQASDVHVKRSPAGLRIEARYVVRVNLPLYTVDLHFYPSAGER